MFSVTGEAEGHPLMFFVSVSSGSISDVEFWVEDGTAVLNQDYAPTNGYTGISYLYRNFATTDDEIAESLKSLEVHARFIGRPETEVVAQIDIHDEDGTDPAAYEWAAYISSGPAVEGDLAALYLQANHALWLEYAVADSSADEGDDYAGPLTWTAINVYGVQSAGQYNFYNWVHFPTYDDGVQETRESFEVHVRRQGALSTAIILEADIDDSGFIEIQRVTYAYDYLNQLIRRTLDADGANGDTNLGRYVGNHPTLSTDATGLEETESFWSWFFGGPNKHVVEAREQHLQQSRDAIVAVNGSVEELHRQSRFRGEYPEAALDAAQDTAIEAVTMAVPSGADDAAIAVARGRKFLKAVTTVCEEAPSFAKSLGEVGGESAQAAKGRGVHEAFKETVRGKPGWKASPRLIDPKTGKTVIPDALTPSGRPGELKPNTPSGRAAGASQLKKYERATGKRGHVIYCDP